MSPRSKFGCAVVLVAAIALALNHLVRVAAPNESESTGIIVVWARDHGLGVTLGAGVAAMLAAFVVIWALGFVRGLATPDVARFWSLMARHPDYGYDWLSRSSAWKILPHPLPADYRDLVPSAEWAGPFDLYVPSQGRRIKIFGRIGSYEASRGDFVHLVRNPGTSRAESVDRDSADPDDLQSLGHLTTEQRTALDSAVENLAKLRASYLRRELGWSPLLPSSIWYADIGAIDPEVVHEPEVAESLGNRSQEVYRALERLRNVERQLPFDPSDRQRGQGEPG